MKQYLELNAKWASYVPLSIEDLEYSKICKRFDLEALNTAELIDAYIIEKRQGIIAELKAQDFDVKYLEPLYIKERAFSEAETITSETDLEIVERFNQDFGFEAANVFSKIEIDFYYLERYLRTRSHGAFPAYGNIEKVMFERHFNIDSLVRNSLYFKELQGLKVRNFESKFDDYKIMAMSNFVGEARGVNGIFAKVYFKLVDLQNIRIVLKGHLYGMDVSKIVRDVNA